MLPIELATVIENDEDREYVERIYEKYKKQMYVAANKILFDEAESWGAVHDTIIVVTDYLDVFRDWTEQHQVNFLCKCTRTFAYKEYKRNKTYKENTFSISDTDEAPEIDIADDSMSLENLYINEENKKIIREAIEEMDQLYGDMLYFKYYMNMRNVDIARTFKIKLGTVNVRLSRAMAQLRTSVEGKL